MVAYLLEIERILSDSGRFGNSRFYAATADSIRAFRPRALLNDLTADWLARYEAWMRKRGKTYSVPVSEKAAAILERNRRAGDAYLFPIYSTGVHVTDQQKFNRLHKVSRQVNLCVRDLAARTVPEYSQAIKTFMVKNLCG